MKLPLPSALADSNARSRFGWIAIRLLLAGLLAAHGWVRFLDGGVVPFGEWLTSQGMPFGLSVATTITAIEILGTPLLALGKFVAPLAVLYSSIYSAGIVMVHAPEGWFVVGKGRNGVEYSVLLIVCLLCVGLQHVTPRRLASAASQS